MNAFFDKLKSKTVPSATTRQSPSDNIWQASATNANELYLYPTNISTQKYPRTSDSINVILNSLASIQPFSCFSDGLFGNILL